ncbi:MAG: hypothetical protein ACRD59_05600 [Candidatus Acidiferrales bacterium]
MRYRLVLVGIVFLVTLSVGAQGAPTNPLLAALPFSGPFATSSDLAATASMVRLGANLSTATASVAGALPDGWASSAALNPATDPEPQSVFSVHQNYSWQAYVGYTFFRFYESSHPTIRENQNGVNWSIVYYWKDWLGFEGEMAATYGTQGGQDSWFLFGGGGPRFRWSGPRGLELWGHVLFGGSHFTPQTPFGKQEAFAYEAGGGVDVHSPFQRIAFRVGADMVASRYFSTYQYSPKVFTGIVFKF